MKDINGTEITAGVHIELVDQMFLGETLFGKVHIIRDERYPEYDGKLGVATNNSFTVPLFEGHRYRIIDDYLEFFAKRYDKEHGKGAHDRLKKTLKERGLNP